MNKVRVQFQQEALKVISDEDYRPRASVEFLAALTCFLVMGFLALVLWAHDLARAM